MAGEIPAHPDGVKYYEILDRCLRSSMKMAKDIAASYC